MPLYNPNAPIQVDDTAYAPAPLPVPVANYATQQQAPDAFVQPISSGGGTAQPSYAPMSVQTTQRDITPEAQNYMGKSAALFDQALAEKTTAAGMELKSQENVNRLMAEQQAKISQNAIDQQAAYLKRSQALEEATNRQQVAIGVAEKEFKDSKIDGMRIFKQDNSNRAIAAISIALGAMGSAFTGQKNYALDIINGIIDRDTEEQKFEANKKYTTFENSKKGLDIIDRNFATQTERDAMNYKLKTDAVIAKTEEAVLGAKNPQIRANGTRMIADLKEQAAAKLAALYQVAASAAPTTTVQTQTGQAPISTQLAKADFDEHRVFTQAKTSVNSLFDEGAKITFRQGMTPSAIGGKATEAENISSSIGAVLAEKLKQRSDADWTNIVMPLTPRPKDTPEVLAYKKKNLNLLLDGYAPAGYLKIREMENPQRNVGFTKTP